MDYQQFANFIRTNAPTAQRASLLTANSRPFADKNGPTAGKAKIFLTYYSMPDWLDIFNFEAHLKKGPFDHVIAEYKHAAQKHQDKVAACVDRISTFASGKALLTELGSTGHTLRIMPYWHYFRTMPGGDYFNATPMPVKPGETMAHISDGTPHDFEDEYEKGAPVRGDDNEPVSSLGKGTGKGADVVLFFSAETWESKDAPKGPGFKPDEVLFHELVHVTRSLRGRMTHVGVEGGGYRNLEEYFATVITNVYLSEKEETRLRGFYSNDLIRPKTTRVVIQKQEIMIVTDPLPGGWSVMKDPEKFYENADKISISPRELMQIFKNKQPAFYFALAHLPESKPKFNPMGRHFRENMRPAKSASSRRP
jgi:Effector protein